jgi:hypothetical protein
MKRNLTRRTLLQAGAAVTGGLAASKVMSPGGIISPSAFAQAGGDGAPAEKSALLVIFLNGGFNSVFVSADSFAPAGTFGVTAQNQRVIGGGLVVDAPTIGTLDAFSLSHIAAVGVRHGISNHGAAQVADWTNGTRSFPLMLANAMGGEAAIKCAVLGAGLPAGPKPPEGTTTMQSITDLRSTIAALGGGAADPTTPDRAISAKGLIGAQAMSKNVLGASPVSLTSVREGYGASIATLQKPVQAFDYNAMAAAYGIAPTATAVNTFASKMLGAELMISAGANVAIAMDGGWDSHGDRTAANVRNMMNTRILPALKVFLTRMNGAESPRNVVVTIMGDFARSLPGSDHASALSAMVIGKYVKPGTTGLMSPTVSLADGTASTPGYWSLLSRLVKLPAAAGDPLFGANPHPSLLL